MAMTKIKAENLSLSAICNSGQVFRMYERRPGLFDIYSGDRHLQAAQTGREITLFCDKDEYETYWKDYFDLNRDYSALIDRAKAADDEFVLKGIMYGGDIRILRQNIWEMMISFIISQQKQIPSIRKCIEGLCAKLGTKKSEGDREWYAFPTPEQIVNAGPEGVKGLSLGYRERYIYETAGQYLERGITDEELKALPYSEAKKYLLSFTGIGEKVANCILLFGAGFVDAFPIDTHIQDILYREYYLKECREEGRDASPESMLKMQDYERLTDRWFAPYAGYRGIVQQWIFAYEIGMNNN